MQQLFTDADLLTHTIIYINTNTLIIVYYYQILFLPLDELLTTGRELQGGNEDPQTGSDTMLDTGSAALLGQSRVVYFGHRTTWKKGILLLSNRTLDVYDLLSFSCGESSLSYN